MMIKFFTIIACLWLLSCNYKVESLDDKQYDKPEIKETIIFSEHIINAKISEKMLVKLSLDSINYSERLKLFQKQNIDFDYVEPKDEKYFVIETEKCFIKFISNFSESDSFKVYRDKNSIGDFHFISIEGLDGITTLLINKKSSTYQLFDGELIFNEEKRNFLIMKNDVDYSTIKVFKIENGIIYNQENFFSEINFIQNISLTNDKLILKTKLPKSKPQIYEIMN